MVEVVSVSRLSAADKRRIEEIDPSVRLTDAGAWFEGEIAESWPRQAARNYLGNEKVESTRAQRDAVLAKAEVIVGGFPYPLDVCARAPKLRWYHQRNAGASNLWRGDLWRSKVMITTSRGGINVRPIAEYVVAGLLHIARDFPQAERDRAERVFERHRHRPLLLAGKTACIVGAGGIGREAGRLLAAIGMRVVGVRHSASAAEPLPEGFAEMHGRDGLFAALGQSHAAVICAQLTEDTVGLMGTAAFAAMPPGGILVNIARGELVDEDAMLAALDGGHLRGAVLDVYVGEFDGPPPEKLWHHPRILVTPHDSGTTEVRANLGIDIFCNNLRAYLDGRPLANVIDWSRGY